MKSLKTITFVSFIALATTTSVFASWWNPFTWGIFKRGVSVVQQTNPVSTNQKEESKNKEVEVLAVASTSLSTETKAIKVMPTTENWKTYSKYGFQLQYPSDFEIRESDTNLGTLISFEKNGSNAVLMVHVNTQAWDKGTLKSPANCNDFDPEIETSEVKIHEVNFIKGDISRDLSGMSSRSSTKEYCTIQAGTAYKIIPRIIFAREEDAQDVDNSIVLNQIITTFKINEPVKDKNIAYAQSDFTWLIQNLGDEGKYGAPHNKVSLQINSVSEKQNIGEYFMNCSEQPNSYYKGNAKISKSVICWWAGDGKEMAVFLENGKYLVKVADIDEGNPNIKLPPIEFKTVLEIKK